MWPVPAKFNDEFSQEVLSVPIFPEVVQSDL